MNALQILAELGPGRIMAQMEREEDVQLARSIKALGG